MIDERERRNFGRVYRRRNSRFWWVRFRLDGKEYNESSGSTSKRKAEELLARRQAELGVGAFVEPDVRRTRFENLAEILIDDYKINGRRSTKRAENSLDHLRDYFGNTKAVRVTTDRIVGYVRHRLDAGAAAATIQRELAALRRAFRLALRAGKVAAVPHIPRLEIDNVRTGFLTEGDLRAVLAELPLEVRPLVEFLRLTGWRRGEALGLTWRQVDFDGGVVRLEPGSTKNREGREFPFAALPRLKALLRQQRAYTDRVERATGRIVRRVFHRDGEPIQSFRGAWEGACVRAGLGRWKKPEKRTGYVGPIVHDLRRCAVMSLERAGVSRSTAMQLTGHKTESVYRRYAIVSARDLREGVEKLARLHENQASEQERTTLRFLEGNKRPKGTEGGQLGISGRERAGGGRA